MSSCFKYLLVHSSPQSDWARANKSKFAKKAYTYVLHPIRRFLQDNEGYKDLETSSRLPPLLDFSRIFVMLLKCISLPLWICYH